MTLEDLFALRDDLPLAPVYARQDTDLARAIDSRRFATGRACASCRAEAGPVLYMNASDLLGLPRWLDLCWPCYSSLVSMVLQLGLDDAEIIERWEAWRVTRG